MSKCNQNWYVVELFFFFSGWREKTILRFKVNRAADKSRDVLVMKKTDERQSSLSAHDLW